MSRRTIGPDGRDELPEGEKEQQVPVWHSIVGADHEPVQVNDVTHLGEDVLVASGWIAASGGGFRQQPDSLPRRRRKAERFAVIIRNKDGRQTAGAFVQAGQCIQVDSKGELIPIDKPPAQSAE